MNCVVQFLLRDRELPRSIHYGLRQADGSPRAISGALLDSFQNPAERRLGQLRAEFDFKRVSEIISSGLHEFIDDFQTKLNGVGAAIAEHFFAKRPIESRATCFTREKMRK